MENCWVSFSAFSKEDRHLATFITEWVWYCYCVASQGCVASGDAYNARNDEIIVDIQRKTQCVDDAMIRDPDEDLEEHWWCTLDYLTLVGDNCVILTLKKLHRSHKISNFA